MVYPSLKRLSSFIEIGVPVIGNRPVGTAVDQAAFA